MEILYILEIYLDFFLLEILKFYWNFARSLEILWCCGVCCDMMQRWMSIGFLRYHRNVTGIRIDCVD